MKFSCICCGLFARKESDSDEDIFIHKDETQQKIIESHLAWKKIAKKREEKEGLLFAEEMSPLAMRSIAQSPLQTPRIR